MKRALLLTAAVIFLNIPFTENSNAFSNQKQKDVEFEQNCYDSSLNSLAYSYCVTTTVGSQSKDVLYFFHGAFGNEKNWTGGINADMRQRVRLYWQESGYDAPTVISLSLGTLWMVRDHESKDGDLANLDLITNSLIPELEDKHLGGELQGRRLLMGVSMGGFNALTLMMKRPELWNKAAIIAPMIPLCDPWISDIKQYICVSSDENKNNLFLAKIAHDLVKAQFPLPEQWESANPLNLAKSELNPNSVPFLLTVGNIDSFGFYTNGKQFAERAQNLGAPITWLPTGYKHGVYDAEVLAEYLISE
ncbi:hypothetical protein GW915_07585 [bacterium]|nr:hypothetical protein [bacterium]